MKRNVSQLIIVVLAIVMAIAVPTSFAKFSATESYTIKLKNNIETEPTGSDKTLWIFDYTSAKNAGNSLKLNWSGYYAIIVRGGDGAEGFQRNHSHNYFDRKGGYGGTVMGVYHMQKDEVLYVYPGTAGSRTTIYLGSAVAGSAGKNDKIAAGGVGSASIANADWLTKWLSAEVGSGGGGAGSAVYLDGTASSNLLMLAGGGGSGGSCDEESTVTIVGAKMYSAYYGGNAGSNKADSVYGIFDGEDGSTGGSRDKSNYTGDKVYGCGATSNGPGNGGSIQRMKVSIDYVPEGKGNVGKSFSEMGAGGNASQYGGAGGGGYCGGGSGTGTSIWVGAGGGGGGSSYVAQKASNKYNEDVFYATNAFSSVLSSASGSLPASKGTTTDTVKYGGLFGSAYTDSRTVYTEGGNGYIVIKYLGKDKSVIN